jgi:hypothetical protein
MEASVIFVVASFLRRRAGGIMIAGGTGNALEVLIGTAVDATKLLIEQDRAHQA